ncbi:MAG TPA: cupin domain-containing protein [Thermoleophilaceae bacterium]|nr:cupin domain-containing protein [Thermoleophilaceae bacterium]
MSLDPVPEAPLRRRESGGLVPEGDGWFVVNVAESHATHSDRFGTSARFEDRPEVEFPEFGINVRVLQPGQPASLYHRENAQEVFLVLSGECVAIVEEEERPLRKGDLLYMPSGTAHVLVGAGDGPSAVLMAGTRKDPEELLYPVSEAAARYGASAERETSSEDEAYGDSRAPRPVDLGLPW